MALGKKLKLDRLIPHIDLEKDQVAESTENVSPQESTSVSVEAVVQTAPSIIGNSALDAIVSPDIKVEFIPSKRKTQKKVFVHLSGDLTIRNVNLLKDKIPALFDEFDHVELVLKEITGIDITTIQLFNLMRVNYHSFGKFTYINAELTAEQKKMLNTCGFSEFNSQITASAS